MELDELKQQWAILNEKLDKQQLINRRMMENAIGQKIDFISAYNWIGIIIGVCVIPFILFMNQMHNLENWVLTFIIGMLVFFVILGVYKALQFNRTKSFKNNIIDTERLVVEHEKISFWYYLITFVVLFSFMFVSGYIFYDRLVASNRLWIFSTIIIAAIIGGIWEMRWYMGKIKKLHQSISDLKEFEKEE